MRRRLGRIAALGTVAAVAAVGAGCGGTRSSTGTSTDVAVKTGSGATTARSARSSHTRALTAREKAVKFSECMRAHSVSDFPDPDASGEFPSYGVSVTEAVWTRAVAACKSLQPPGTLSAKLTPAQESAALEFAQCVRKHGVRDFPDPVSGQPLIDTDHIPSANKPGGMTILNAATNTCGRLLAQRTGGQ